MNKKELLEKANAAYREGNPIIGDAEYDELEKELGLENENEIGEKHSPEMTVKHPFIMGSLSKVQVHEVNGSVDWGDILKSIQGYVKNNSCIITPKYDGCSFELYIKNGKIESCSTRGDGYWGRDISKYVISKVPEKYLNLEHDEYVLRGEILIRKDVFENKYKDEYVNTRAFVAGVTGSDDSAQEMIDDLDIVIYDYRTFDEGNWYDVDWTYLPDSDLLPRKSFLYVTFDSAKKVEEIYNIFDEYRKECEYSLDGFVIKSRNRRGEFVNPRPKDCVAIKFLPMVNKTIVEKIEWSLGKTGEYAPIVYYQPIIMDGKTCIKASGHNYAWLNEKGVRPGSEVIISMAGDIIPYIYKVIKASNNIIDVPSDSYVASNGHLMKVFNDNERIVESFRNSCTTLNINGLGDSQIQKIIDYVKEDDRCIEADVLGLVNKKISLPFNVLLLDPDVIEDAIGGKNGQKIAKEFKKVVSNISLETIIESMNIRLCGKKLSAEIAKYLTGQKYDFESKAYIGYKWIFNKDSQEFKNLYIIFDHLGMDIDYFKNRMKKSENVPSNRIKIIMTGEPTTASTKKEFLNMHQEYEETTSWKEVQIVFTNSLDSNTGKMKKAREKGINIQTY